jgi:hypothetical protein
VRYLTLSEVLELHRRVIDRLALAEYQRVYGGA